MREVLKQAVWDARAWILCFFLLRLPSITLAPLEVSHHWRQTLSLMVARNFSTSGFDPMHPMMDLAGPYIGIIGTEFPFFNTLIFGFNELFGYEHWYGRLINLIVSSLAVWAFYKLLKLRFETRIALCASLVFMASEWFMFGRKTMPDTFSVSLVILALYFLYRYLVHVRWWDYLLYTILLILGSLSKLPAVLTLGLVLVFWEALPKKGMKLLWVLLPVTLAAIGTYLWYFQWVPHLVETYHVPLFFPHSVLEGFQRLLPWWSDLLGRFSFSALRSYVAFTAFIAGAGWIIWRGAKPLKWMLLGVTALVMVYAAKTGDVFARHDYYILPYVPFMAMAAGVALGKLPPKWSWLLVSVVLLEGVLNQVHDLREPESQRYKLALEEKIDEVVPEGERIVINGGQNPQLMYFANRKGWSLNPHEFSSDTLRAISRQGVRFVVLDKAIPPEDAVKGRVVHEDANIVILHIEP